MTRPETAPESGELARRIGALMLAKAATDVLVLDLRGISSACDYFVIGTGGSEPQVKAIADHVEESLREEGVRPWHVEGRSQRRWVLLDYVHVVAHVFHKEARDYYLLERLWSDARREVLEPRNPSSVLQPSQWDAEEDSDGENDSRGASR